MKTTLFTLVIILSFPVKADDFFNQYQPQPNWAAPGVIAPAYPVVTNNYGVYAIPNSNGTTTFTTVDRSGNITSSNPATGQYQQYIQSWGPAGNHNWGIITNSFQNQGKR